MPQEPFIYDRFECKQCAHKGELDFDFTMAFQPIVDCSQQKVFGYEALVRGLNNESAFSIISKVDDDNRYLFDQLCRVKAIALASELGLEGILSINFLPNAVYKPERCIRTTLDAAKKHQFPLERIMFEFTEVEKIEDSNVVLNIVDFYRGAGFITAIDDFGSGYSGLNLLADFQTNIGKFDMELIRNVDTDSNRQAILRNCIQLFKDLNITPLAEGIETQAEFQWLKAEGVSLMQGYYFAKPGFQSLPPVDLTLLTSQ